MAEITCFRDDAMRSLTHAMGLRWNVGIVRGMAATAGAMLQGEAKGCRLRNLRGTTSEFERPLRPVAGIGWCLSDAANELQELDEFLFGRSKNDYLVEIFHLFEMNFFSGKKLPDLKKRCSRQGGS